MSRSSGRWSRAVSRAIVLLFVFFGGAASLQAALISSFTVWARNDVMIGVGSQVTGLVGAGVSVVGDDGDSSLNGTARVNGDIRSSDDVTLGNSTVVTDTITNPGSFTVGSNVSFGAHVTAMPDLPTAPPATVFSSGGTSQSLGNGVTLNLAPGSYNNITVGGNSTINLTTGTYFLNSLTAGGSLDVNVDLTSGNHQLRLFVTDDVNIAGLEKFIVTGGNESNVYVETHHTGTNAFKIAGNGGTNFSGTIYTPNGDIHVGSGSSQGTLTGYFWAGGNVDIEHGLDIFPGLAPGPGPFIPEPSSLALLVAGVLGLAGFRWRRRTR